MNLNCETILDFYTYKNRKVLCQIQVNPKSVKFKNSCRCLSQEHWKAFDNELEKLITTIDDWNNGKCLTFIIKPYIHVNVRKSNLKFENFDKCFGAFGGCDIGVDADLVEENVVLECLFDFQLDVPFSSPTESQDYRESPFVSMFSPLSPSRIKFEDDDIDTVKTAGTNFLEYNEDTHSSKRTSNKTAMEPLLTKSIITCNPAPTDATRSSDDSDKSSDIAFLNKVIVNTDYEIGSRLKDIGCSEESNISNNSDLHNVHLFKKGDKNECRRRDKSLKSKSNTNYETVENQKPCVVEEELECLQSDNLAEQRCKSENVIPERKKRHKHSHNKVIKKQSNNLDEIPAALLVDMEKPQPKNKKEGVSEIWYKKLDKRDKSSFHKSKNGKCGNSCTIKNINKSETKPERSSIEDKLNVSSKTKSKNDSKTVLTRSDSEFEADNELNKNIILHESNKNVTNLNSFLSLTTETTAEPLSTKVTQVDRKASTREDTKSLRRSERSPNKPKRLIDEQNDVTNLKKSKKYKFSLHNKEVFGEDDDDEDYFVNNNDGNIKKDNNIKTSVFGTPINKKPVQCISSSSSTKHKHKRDKSSSECDQEKRGMSKWLSKKKIMPLDKGATKSSKAPTKTSSFKTLPLKTSTKIKSRKADVDSENRSQSSTPSIISLELPSKQEMELIRNKTKLIQTENAKVRAELDKMRTSPPKEVEILSLQNIPLDDILDTFLTYKSELDEIYENNRKKDYIKGHDGINHCFVIRLLQQSIQMKMLEKLTEVYTNSNTTTQATLFANALLPEWVIRVYMNKFHFTRQQAIDQIKAQEEFQLHMEDQGDNTFIFD